MHLQKWKPLFQRVLIKVVHLRCTDLACLQTVMCFLKNLECMCITSAPQKLILSCKYLTTIFYAFCKVILSQKNETSSVTKIVAAALSLPSIYMCLLITNHLSLPEDINVVHYQNIWIGTVIAHENVMTRYLTWSN